MINYEKQTWDADSYVQPTRMNHIEEGIKEACDKIDNIGDEVLNARVVSEAPTHQVINADNATTALNDSLGNNIAQQFEQVNNTLTGLFKEEVTLFEGAISAGNQVFLAENIANFKAVRIVSVANQGSYEDYIVSNAKQSLMSSVNTYNPNLNLFVLMDVALTTNDGHVYNCVRNSQVNLSESGVSYFNGASSNAWRIIGLR